MSDKSLIDQIDNLEIHNLRESPELERIPPFVVYQQKRAKCGCKKCKEGGPGHGLYWYAYFTYLNKTHCICIGKEKRNIDVVEELRKKNKKIGGK